MDIKKESFFVDKLSLSLDIYLGFFKDLFYEKGKAHTKVSVKRFNHWKQSDFSLSLEYMNCDTKAQEALRDAYVRIGKELSALPDDYFIKDNEGHIALKSRDPKLYENLLDAWHSVSEPTYQYLKSIGLHDPRNIETIQEYSIMDVLNAYALYPISGEDELSVNENVERQRKNSISKYHKFKSRETFYMIKNKFNRPVEIEFKTQENYYLIFANKEDAKLMEKDIASLITSVGTIELKKVPKGYDFKKKTYVPVNEEKNELDKEEKNINKEVNKEKKLPVKKETNKKKSVKSKVKKSKGFFRSITNGFKKIFISIARGVKRIFKGVGEGVSNTFSKAKDVDYSSLFSLQTLFAIIPVLVMGALVVLEVTDVIYKVGFDVGWVFYGGYNMKLTGLLTNWLTEFDHNFFTAITLGLIQIILIVIGFILDLVITLLIFVGCLIFAFLLIVFQFVIVFGGPVALVGWLIYRLIKSFGDDDDTGIKILNFVCLALVVAGAIFYYMETISAL